MILTIYINPISGEEKKALSLSQEEITFKKPEAGNIWVFGPEVIPGSGSV